MIKELKIAVVDTLPGDPKCGYCNGTGKARVSCCTGEVVTNSKHCPKCGAELEITTCPECSGGGYEAQ